MSELGREDASPGIIEWGNLTLPMLCPGCAGPATREQRLYASRSSPPQLLAQYACDAVLTSTPGEMGQPQINVTNGCRLLLLKTILTQRD